MNGVHDAVVGTVVFLALSAGAIWLIDYIAAWLFRSFGPAFWGLNRAVHEIHSRRDIERSSWTRLGLCRIQSTITSRLFVAIQDDYLAFEMRSLFGHPTTPVIRIPRESVRIRRGGKTNQYVDEIILLDQDGQCAAVVSPDVADERWHEAVWVWRVAPVDCNQSTGVTK